MFPKALAELGYLELDAWHLESAGKYIRAFYDTYPGSTRARKLMTLWSVRTALAAARAGNLAAAERACRDGIELIPDSGELHGFLGMLFAQQKRIPEALTALENSRRLDPTNPRVLLTLGQVYAELGRIEDARQVLTEGERRVRAFGDEATSAQYRELLQRLPR
jgi:predicted Zn-dependent protease